MFLPIGDNISKKHLPILTCTIIIVNVLIFALEMRMMYSAEDQTFSEEKTVLVFRTFGLIPEHITSGEITVGTVTSLFTHMFMHGDIFHILGNMLVLWAFGCSLEGTFGWFYFLLMYVFWGLCAAAGHILADPASTMPMVGASGAIAGLIGAYTVKFGYASNIKCVFFFFYRPYFFQMPAIFFGGLWIAGQLWSAGSTSVEEAGVAWFAHIGGFIAGAAVMLCIRNRTKYVLVESRGGVLEFKDRKEFNGEVEEEEVVTGPLDVPECCPYCHTQMSEENRMNDAMARCPNQQCQRLIGLEHLGV